MQAPEARELGLGKAWNCSENPNLLRMFELGLEADHIPERAQRIVLPQLNNGMRARAAAARISADTSPLVCAIESFQCVWRIHGLSRAYVSLTGSP